jgi:ABC-2 type transport system ATP-binding protein
LLGPNGSGKTTTLGVIMSVLKADTGYYRWFGREADPQTYRNIGCLLEVPNFFNYLSLKRNLEVIARVRETDISDIDRVLDETGLLHRSGSRFDTLSLGMKQRLGLAAALLGNPEVLVLDEPANGLDPEGIAEVRNLILLQRENGKTIIMASHILDEVEKVCTHVAVLKSGKVIASGKVNELLSSDDVIVAETDNNEKFRMELEAAAMVKSISIENELLEIIPTKSVSSADINSFAISRGFTVNQLFVRKATLEEQFLELVKE